MCVGREGTAFAPHGPGVTPLGDPGWAHRPCCDLTGNGHRERRAILPTHCRHLRTQSAQIFRGDCGFLFAWVTPTSAQRGPRPSHRDESHKEGRAGHPYGRPRVRQMGAHPSHGGRQKVPETSSGGARRACWQLMSPN